MCLPVSPYKIEWQSVLHGYLCVVVQNEKYGNRCGYVRIPPGHPYFNKDYAIDVQVHGGLTFFGNETCKEHAYQHGWWMGFDCGHAGDHRTDPSVSDELLSDVQKIMRTFEKKHTDILGGELPPLHFWTLEETVEETLSLAEQLVAINCNYSIPNAGVTG
jgi:hypothetical protein